jgi:hypothetical protein
VTLTVIQGFMMNLGKAAVWAVIYRPLPSARCWI